MEPCPTDEREHYAGELANLLQQEINHLASSNDAPAFAPHVTVVAGADGTEQDILRKAAELAATLEVDACSGRSTRSAFDVPDQVPCMCSLMR